jgi:hypothetical protein
VRRKKASDVLIVTMHQPPPTQPVTLLRQGVPRALPDNPAHTAPGSRQ